VRGAEKLFRATARRSARLPYLLYEPERPAPSAWGDRHPLVVFLHGIEERGDELSRVAVHGPPLLAEAGRTFPFYLAAPQCPADSSWIFELDGLRLFLKELVYRLHIDTERIILTGLNMGGFGTWHLAVENPHAFAGIVPVCGGAACVSGLKERIRTIAHVPVWAFHGGKDDVVPLALEQELVDALREAGGTAELTVYPEAGHDSWTPAYQDPKLYEWIMERRNATYRL
jgi:predicted peptidase